ARLGRRVRVGVVLLDEPVGRDALALGLLARLDEAPQRDVRDAGDPDDALRLELAERADGLGDRRVEVVHVPVEHVEVVDAEMAQALVRLVPDDVRPEALEVRRRRVRQRERRVLLGGAELGREADVVARAPAREPAAEQVLAVAAVAPGPGAVVVRRVEERAARLAVAVEDRERRLLVDERAHVHGAEAEGRHVERGAPVADGAVPHGGLLGAGGPWRTAAVVDAFHARERSVRVYGPMAWPCTRPIPRAPTARRRSSRGRRCSTSARGRARASSGSSAPCATRYVPGACPSVPRYPRAGSSRT